MPPSFDALQIIAEIALGIVGFSAILIGLSRTSDGFTSPDNFRIQLLTYSAFGSMFCALFPFAIFGEGSNEISWSIILWILCLYSSAGLLVFPRRMILLRSVGYKDIFPWQLCFFQTSILLIIFLLSLLMILGYIPNQANVYIGCLILFLVQSSVAFIRTMFVRVK